MTMFETKYINNINTFFKYDNIPLQKLCSNIDEFSTKFSAYCLDNSISRVLIFSDGVHKTYTNVFLKNDIYTTDTNLLDTDEILLTSLSSLNILFEYINITYYLNISDCYLHAHDFYIDKISCLLNNKIYDAIIVIGSGTITDLIKHAIFVSKINTKFISIPTALTVTAYTSTFAVLDINGVKRTQSSAMVNINFWIIGIIINAPLKLNKSGFGDLLAAFIASGDWYLAYIYGFAPNYSDIPIKFMKFFLEEIDIFSKEYSNNQFSSSGFVWAVFSLVSSGLAMNKAKETTPLSGGEHAFSHALDFMHSCINKNLVLHGEQVGLCSLYSAKNLDIIKYKLMHDFNFFIIDKINIQKKAFNKFLIVFNDGLTLLNNSEYKEKYLEAKNIFAEDFMRKINTWGNINNYLNLDKFSNDYLSFDKINKYLINANLPRSISNTEPQILQEHFDWALKFVPFVRNRFTSYDLLFFLSLYKE